MGKIVKYCQSCDESFAEKFGFCPNCGESMQAFEMNPVGGGMRNVSAKTDGGGKAETVSPSAPEVSAKTESAKAPATAATVSSAVAANAEKAEAVSKPAASKAESVEPQPQAPVKETKTYAATATASSGAANYKPQTASGDGYRTVESQAYTRPADYGDFHVNVIEDKDGKRRGLLLLGALLLMMSIASGGMIYSIFNHPLGVGAVGDEGTLSMSILDDTVPPIEDDKPPKPDKSKGGGCGGGGKHEDTDASKGRLVSQSENPITPPSAHIPQLTNPSLPLTMETQGKIKRPITDERPGLPNSVNLDPSDGRGSGGGIGRGNGTGIGGGNGTGEGNGNGSGSGNGDGNGYGNGRGGGANIPPPPPAPPKHVAVTEKIKIISKPRAEFTEEARKNNFTV